MASRSMKMMNHSVKDGNSKSRSRSNSKGVKQIVTQAIMNSTSNKKISSTKVNNMIAGMISSITNSKKVSQKNFESSDDDSSMDARSSGNASPSPVREMTTKTTNNKKSKGSNAQQMMSNVESGTTKSKSTGKKNMESKQSVKTSKNTSMPVENLSTEENTVKKTKKSKKSTNESVSTTTHMMPFCGSMEDAIRECIMNLKSKASMDCIRTCMKTEARYSSFFKNMSDMEFQMCISKMESSGMITMHTGGVYCNVRDMEQMASMMSPSSKEMMMKMTKEMEEEMWRNKVIVIEETPIKVKIENSSEHTSLTKASENSSPDISHQKNKKKQNKKNSSSLMMHGSSSTHSSSKQMMSASSLMMDETMINCMKSLFPSSCHMNPSIMAMIQNFNGKCGMNEYEMKVFNMIMHMMEMRDMMMTQEMMSNSFKCCDSTDTEFFKNMGCMMAMMCSMDLKMMMQMMRCMMMAPTTGKSSSSEQSGEMNMSLMSSEHHDSQMSMMMNQHMQGIMMMKSMMNIVHAQECGFNEIMMSTMTECDHQMMMITYMMSKCSSSEMSNHSMMNMFMKMMDCAFSCNSMSMNTPMTDSMMKMSMNCMMPPQMNLSMSFMKQECMQSFMNSMNKIFVDCKKDMSESQQNIIMEMMNRLNNCTSESYLKMMQSDMNMHCMMNHMMSMMMRMPHKSMMCNMIECMNNMIMMSTRSNMMSSSSMLGSSTNSSGMMRSFSMNMNNTGNNNKFSPMRSESMNGEMFCKMMRMMTSHNIRMMHESMNIMMNMYCCPSTMKMMMNGECHSNMSMIDMLSCMMMMETVCCDVGSEHTYDLIHSSCFSMMCSFMKNNEYMMKCLMETCFNGSTSSPSEKCEQSAERMMLMNMCCMMEQVDEKHVMNMCKNMCEKKNSMMMNPMEFMEQMMNSWGMNNRCKIMMNNNGSNSMMNSTSMKNMSMDPMEMMCNSMMCGMSFQDKMSMMAHCCECAFEGSNVESCEKMMHSSMETCMKGMLMNPFFSKMNCGPMTAPISSMTMNTGSTSSTNKVMTPEEKSGSTMTSGSMLMNSANMMKSQMLSTREKMHTLLNEMSEKSMCMIIQSMCMSPMMQACMAGCRSMNQMEMMMKVMMCCCTNMKCWSNVCDDSEMMKMMKKMIENEVKQTNMMNMMMMEQENKKSMEKQEMMHTGMMGESNLMDTMEAGHASAADTNAMMGACGHSQEPMVSNIMPMMLNTSGASGTMSGMKSSSMKSTDQDVLESGQISTSDNQMMDC